mgnify:CR=1 FL=1
MTYAIINISDLLNIDFTQIGETSKNTIRNSSTKINLCRVFKKNGNCWMVRANAWIMRGTLKIEVAPKRKRKGIHAKSKTSKLKGSKNYSKKYNGQGK